ncbi:PRC and DUF2382 domain-containing protein [Nocardia sp. NPDC024068]|uniref:PRC and DUF2382 domain-containing protein n=1 Tax=Nocardia sp. NPDC024068 TaxID=3157197 RepID=UPI0033F177BE
MAQHVEDLIGDAVYDLGGAKIGKVKRVYVDNSSGAPTWAAVSTGMFSEDSLVPLAGAQVREGSHELQVRVRKDAVRAAPHLAHDGLITQESEDELFVHYGLDQGRTGMTDYGRHAEPTATGSAGTAAGTTAGPAGLAGGPAKTTGDTAARPPTPAEHVPTAERPATTERPGAREHTTASRHPDSLVRSEEHLNIGTEEHVVGRARLRKYVVTEEQTITVPVMHEEVHIEREPITDPSSVTPHFGEEEQEVTLHAERVTVSKESVPVERVRLAVDEVADEETISDTVRKERIDIEGIDRDDRRR